MRKLIILLTLTVAVTSSLVSGDPTGKTKQMQKAVTEGLWCPMTGPIIPLPSHNNTIAKTDDGVEIYVHCKKCSIGVIRDHEDGAKKCSYCEQPE